MINPIALDPFILSIAVQAPQAPARSSGSSEVLYDYFKLEDFSDPKPSSKEPDLQKTLIKQDNSLKNYLFTADQIKEDAILHSAMETTFHLFLNQVERLINTKQVVKARTIIEAFKEIVANKKGDYKFLSAFFKADMIGSKFIKESYLPLLEADLNLAEIIPEDNIADRLAKTERAINLLSSVKTHIDNIFQKDVNYLGEKSTTIGEKLMRSTSIRFFSRIYSTLAIAYYIRGNLQLSTPDINLKAVKDDLANANRLLAEAFNFVSKGETSFNPCKNIKKLIRHCAFPEKSPATDCEQKYRYSAGSDLVKYETILRPFQLQSIQASLLHHYALLEAARGKFDPKLPKLSLQQKLWPNLDEINIEELKPFVSKAPVIIFYFDKEYEQLSLDFEYGARTYNKDLLGAARTRIGNLLNDITQYIEDPKLADDREKKEVLRQLHHLRLKYQVLEYKIKMALAEDFEEEIKTLAGNVSDYKKQVLSDPEIRGDFENLNELDLLLADVQTSYFYISITKGQANLEKLEKLKNALTELDLVHKSATTRNHSQEIAQLRLRIQVKKTKLLQAALSYFSLDELQTIPEAAEIVKPTIPKTLAAIQENLLDKVDPAIEAMPLLKLELRDAQIENAALQYFLAQDPTQRETSLKKFFEIYGMRTDDFAPRQDLWLYKVLGSIVGRIDEDEVLGYFNKYLGSNLQKPTLETKAQTEQTVWEKLKEKVEKLALESSPKSFNLVSDLTKINREVRLQLQNINQPLASTLYDQGKETEAKDLLKKAQEEAGKIIAEKEYAAVSIQAEAYHLLVKLDQTRLGMLKIDEEIKPEDYYFTHETTKISSDSDLVDFQTRALENILKAGFKTNIEFVKRNHGRLLTEEISKNYADLSEMAEALFPQVGKYGYYQTLADTHLNLAYLNFDVEEMDLYRAYYQESLAWLGKILSSPTTGANLANAKLTLSGFINAISGNHEELSKLTESFNSLPAEFHFNSTQKGVMAENHLLLLGRKLVREIKEDGWFNGKAAVQVNHSLNTFELRLRETWSNLIFHRPLILSDLPQQLSYSHEAKSYQPAAALPELASASKAVKQIFAENMLYLSQEEKDSAKFILQKLQTADAEKWIVTLKEFYTKFLTLKPLQDEIQKDTLANRGDLSREAALLYQESKLFESARKESLKEAKTIMEPVKNSLENIKPQSPLLEFQRQRMLADVYKILGSLVQDLEGFERSGKIRFCKKADDLLKESKRLAKEVKGKSGRHYLKLQSRIVLGDLLYSKAGKKLLPEEELKILEKAGKTYEKILLEKFADGTLKVSGQIRQNLKRSYADTNWRIALLYRQMKGRTSPEADKYFTDTVKIYEELIQEGRTDLAAGSEFNKLFIEYVRLGDKVIVNLNEFIPELRQRHKKLLEIYNKLARVTAENTFFSRELYSARLLLANARTQLEMMQYILSGKTKTSTEFMNNVTQAFSEFERISQNEVKELNLEKELTIVSYDLATCSDGNPDLEAQAALARIIAKIEDPDPEKGLANSPNHSGRTLLELDRIGLEAYTRIGSFATDNDRWGDKEKVIAAIPTILENFKDKKSDIDTLLPLTNSEHADYYFLHALEHAFPLIFSQRMDLKAQGNFWLAQLLSAIALDYKSRLDLAENFAKHAIDSQELEGESLLRSRVVILKILSRKTGLQQYRIDTFLPVANSSYFNGTEALKYAYEVYGALEYPDMPIEWRKIKAEIQQEIAELYKWHTQYFSQALDHYAKVIELLKKDPTSSSPSLRVMESFYQKVKASAYAGTGDIYRIDPLRQNMQKAEEAYLLSFEPLELKEKDENGQDKIMKGEEVAAKIDRIIEEAKQDQSDSESAFKILDLSKNDALAKFFAQSIFDKNATPPLTTESQRTILTRIFIGMASLYGAYTWEKGRDIYKAKVNLALAEKTLNTIQTQTIEHKQLKEQIIELKTRIGNVLAPNLDTSYEHAEYRTAIPKPMDGSRIRVTYPFKAGEQEFSAGLDTILSNKELKPILTLLTRFLNTQTGIVELGGGVGILDASGQMDFSYNLRGLLALLASYQNTPLKDPETGDSIRTHNLYLAASFRPYPLLHEGAPHILVFRFADRLFLNKLLDGIILGSSYSIFFQRSPNYTLGPLSKNKTFDRYQGVLYLDMGGSWWIWRNYLELSAFYKHPLLAKILSGEVSPSEALSDTETLKYAARIYQLQLIYSPHWELTSGPVNWLEKISVIGSLQRSQDPIDKNKQNTNQRYIGILVDLLSIQ